MFILYGIRNKDVSILIEGNDEDSVIETYQVKTALAVFDTKKLAEDFVMRCIPKTKSRFKYNRKTLLAYYHNHLISDYTNLPKNP